MPLNPPQDYRKTLFTHRLGLASARPAATDVLPGTLFYSSDLSVLERSNGTIWEPYSALPGYVIASNSDSGTKNNWNVLGTTPHHNFFIEWSSGSDMTVTGIAGGSNGLDVIFKNVGSAIAYFSTNDGGSSVANRFQNFLPNGSLTPVAPGGSIRWIYDSDWKIVEHFQGNSISYTPSWTASAGTAPAIGNGTLTGSYTVRTRRIYVNIQLTGGSTTTWGNGGFWKFSVPLSLATGAADLGCALAQDIGVANYPSLTAFVDANNVLVISDATGGLWTFNAPFAWGTSDSAVLSFEYAG